MEATRSTETVIHYSPPPGVARMVQIMPRYLAKLTRIRVAGIAGALLLCVGIYYCVERMRGPDLDIDRIDGILRDVKQTDTQWSVDVQRLEMGLNGNYDPVSAPQALMSRYYKDLSAVIGGLKLEAGRADGVRSAVENFKATMDRKTRLVQRIESQYSILSNSSHFLPIACSDVVRALETNKMSAAEQMELTDLLNRLLSETMSFTLQPDSHLQELIKQDIDSFQKMIGEITPAMLPAAEALVQHVGLILKEREAGNSLLVELAALPTAKAVDDMRGAFGKLQEDFTLQRRIYLESAIALSGLLGIMLIYVVVRIYRDYRKLSQSNTYLMRDHDEAQTQLIQAAKMSALGQMVAGITHEINTPLAYLSATFSLLREVLTSTMAAAQDNQQFSQALGSPADSNAKLTAFEDITTLLDDGLHGVEQIGTLVKAMQSFCRLDRAKVGEFDVHSLLDNSLVICRNNIKYVADVEKDYGDIPNISCSPAQISQVFLNLLNNAAQAIPRGATKGAIRIRTRMEEAGVVRVDITDTGLGIPKEVLPKIFDPFFTTKQVGSGTGMGLSIVYRIVKNHGGRILVDSTVGTGTTMSVLLPVGDSEALPTRNATALGEA